MAKRVRWYIGDYATGWLYLRWRTTGDERSGLLIASMVKKQPPAIAKRLKRFVDWLNEKNLSEVELEVLVRALLHLDTARYYDGLWLPNILELALDDTELDYMLIEGHLLC